MFHTIETSLITLLEHMPLELFAFTASAIEEMLAPIPSPTVMIVTGSAAAVQDYSLLGLLALAVIAALGKTLGAYIVYLISDKAENVLTKYLSHIFPVTHDEIEGLGKRLSGGTRDYLMLTLLRAFPFMPSVVVSVGSGVLKVRMRLFIISTFLGTIVRDVFYLYFGYAGVTLLGDIIAQSTAIETLIEVVVVLALLTLFVYLYMKRRRLKL